MKTLTANVAAKCIKQGNQPRFFVRIPDADLFLAIKEFTDAGTAEAYTDSIQRIGTIRHDMDWLGGMGSVSGLDMTAIRLGERVTLCSEASQSPLPQTSSGTYYAGAGRLLAQGSGGTSFADVRNAITAQYAEGTLVVGTAYNAGNDWYTVYRTILQFRVPSDLTTCEDAYLELPGAGNYHAAAFAIHVVPGTWTSFTDAPGLYNDFTGWATSGAYSLTDWNESWTTAEYDTTCRIRLNATARAWMVANPNGIMRLVLISARDKAGTPGPSGNDFVQFTAASAKLNIRYNSKTLENADATIYLDYESTSTTYTGMQSIRKYLVDDYAISDAALDLKLRDNNFRHDPMIPAKTINDADYPNCPDENKGKAIPLVIGSSCDALLGEHKAGIGYEKHFTSHLLTNEEIGLFDYFPCPVVDPGDSTPENPMRVLVSGNTIYRAFLGVPATWSSAARAYGRFVSYTGLVQGTGVQYIDLIPDRRIIGSYNGVSYDDVDVYEDYLGQTVSVIPTAVVESSSVTTPENIWGAGVDMNAANDSVTVAFPLMTVNMPGKVEICFSVVTTGNCELYCNVFPRVQDNVTGGDGVIANSGTPGFSTFTSAAVDFEAAGITTSDHIVIFGTSGVYSEISAVSGHVLTIPTILPATSLEFKIYKAGGEVHSFTNIMKNAIGTADVVLDATEYMTEPLENYQIQVKMFAHSAGIAQVSYLQVKYYTQNDQSIREIYLDKQGNEYGSWITGRSGGTSGDLIENPAHAIESIARNEMSLATADINTTAFDTAATALTAWKYAFQISEQKKASAYMNDLAEQCKARVFWDSDDKLTIRVFNADAYFPKSGTNVPSGFDIFDTTGTPSSDTFTTNPILPGTLKIDRVSMDQVYNDFALKYKRNYASNEYAELLYMTNGAGTAGSVETNALEANLENSQTLDTLKALCADNYTLYGATRTLTFEAWAIRDTATATKLLQYLIERTAERRYKVTLTTKMTAIGHELGDFINVRDARVVDLFGTATAYIKKWEIIEIEQDLDNCQATLTAIEV